MRNEAAARMVAQIHVGVDVLRVLDMPHPADHGLAQPVRDLHPLRLGDAEGRTRKRDPVVDRLRQPRAQECRQLRTQWTLDTRIRQQCAPLHVSFDTLQVPLERRVTSRFHTLTSAPAPPRASATHTSSPSFKPDRPQGAPPDAVLARQSRRDGETRAHNLVHRKYHSLIDTMISTAICSHYAYNSDVER